MKSVHKTIGLALALALVPLACNDATGPEGGTALTLSIMVPAPGGAAPAAALFSAGELTLSDGNNTLVIQSAEVVLREIEFERAEMVGGCGADDGEIDGTDDDSCEEFKAAPILLSLPLDGTVDQTITVAVPPGAYDEVEFDVHKLSDDALDQDLLNQYPAFEGISVRVTGTWNGNAFEYTSDLEAEQEIEFATPMQIDGAANVTFSVDLANWFADGAGNLIDPSSALAGGVNNDLVENNIEASFEGFEDNDHDGVPHDEDDDELGS